MGKGHIVVSNEVMSGLTENGQKIFHAFVDQGKLIGAFDKGYTTKYYIEHPDFITDNKEDSYTLEYNTQFDGHGYSPKLSKLKVWDNIVNKNKVVKEYYV